MKPIRFHPNENRKTARFVLCITVYARQLNLKILGAFHEFRINLWGKGFLLKDLKLYKIGKEFESFYENRIIV